MEDRRRRGCMQLQAYPQFSSQGNCFRQIPQNSGRHLPQAGTVPSPPEFSVTLRFLPRQALPFRAGKFLELFGAHGFRHLPRSSFQGGLAAFATFRGKSCSRRHLLFFGFSRHVRWFAPNPARGRIAHQRSRALNDSSSAPLSPQTATSSWLHQAAAQVHKCSCSRRSRARCRSKY